MLVALSERSPRPLGEKLLERPSCSCGSGARLARFGTKSGGRQPLARVGVAHPLGTEGVRCLAGAVDAIVSLRAASHGPTGR